MNRIKDVLRRTSKVLAVKWGKSLSEVIGWFKVQSDPDKAVGKLRKQGAILGINPRCVLRVNHSKLAILNLSLY